MTRRAGRRAAGLLAALVLLSTAGRCTPAMPAPDPGAADATTAALSALVEIMAARADADSVTVAATAGYARDRIPPDVSERIAALPGLDPTTLADFQRGNAAPAPLPRLTSARVVIRQDAAAPGALTLLLSRAGFSASGTQALVVAETVSPGGVQGEVFLLRREGDGWRVAASAVLFIS